MVAEFLIAGAGVYTYRKLEDYYNRNKWKAKDLREDIKTFNEVCEKNEKDFYLLDGMNTDYGTKFIISLKDTEYSELEKLVSKLEIAFKTDIELEQNLNKCTATLDIFRSKLNDKDNKFIPTKVKPNEVYIGMTNRFDPMILDMNESTHMIVSGSTGVGKSEELKLITANSIHFNDDSKLNLHICNVGNTGDFDDFIDCKQVKSFTEKYEDISKQFEYLYALYDKRMEIFRKTKTKNIKNYNKAFEKKGKAFPYVWLIIDEIASLYPSSSIDKDKAVKEELFNALCDMGRRFRKVGIFLVLGIQRPSKTVFNPELKMNINIKVAFNQNNTASALVAVDSEKVAKIGKRKFLVEYDDVEHWSRSLYINDHIVKETIKPSIISNRQSQPDFNVFLKKLKQEESIDDNKSDTKPKDTKGKDKGKGKGKAVPSKVSKKIVDLEVATEEIKESKSRVKNVSVEEINGHEVINGQICIKVRRRVE